LKRLEETLLAQWNDELLARYERELDALAEPRPRLSLPWSATAQSLPPVDDNEYFVRLTAPRPLDLRIAGGVVEFACNKKRWRFAVAAVSILRPLADGRTRSLTELYKASEGQLDVQTVRSFLGELLRHGLIAVVTD
jgi:hypothetical protein